MERLGFIDQARGLAVIVMVFTHAANALLADTFRHNAWWSAFALMSGFAAPAFLFLSGVTLRLSFTRREQSCRMPGSGGMHPAIRRSLRLLFIGYWLQVPILSLRQLIWSQRQAELARMFDANVLQVIAITALLGFAVLRTFKSEPARNIILTVLTAAFVVATPLVIAGAVSGAIPLPFRAYFAPQPAATFGLFPFSAYLLAGMAASPFLAEITRSVRRPILTAAAGLLLVLGWFLLDAIPGQSPHDYFRTSGAQLVPLRLGAVLMVVSGCRILPAGLTRWLERWGTRSLGIYLLHLVIIYGSPVSAGLAKWYAGSFGPSAMAAVAVSALGLSYAAVALWEYLRRNHPPVAYWTKRLWWAGFWMIFLLNP